MNELLLIVAIAGEKVALPVADIESVTELDLLTPVPRSPAHVVGLSTLRSRVVTVIDCRCALGLGLSAPVASRLAGNWERMTRGLVETDEGPVLLVDIAAVIAGPAEVRAA